MLLTKSTFISICLFGGIGKYLSNVVCSNGVSDSISASFGLNLIFIIYWNYYKYKYILLARNLQPLGSISQAPATPVHLTMMIMMMTQSITITITIIAFVCSNC